LATQETKDRFARGWFGVPGEQAGKSSALARTEIEGWGKLLKEKQIQSH